ncbi:MAG: hypothetical protein LBV00_08775, partial [Propionibacteriaceae bacterium]|nr:hypothetical protein [Propionibacteriaceae bacterium]
MIDVGTVESAQFALCDPALTAADLYAIATKYPALWSQVANHPQAYRDLLEWFAKSGDPASRQIAVARLRGTSPVTPATPAPPAPADTPTPTITSPTPVIPAPPPP